MKTNTITTIVLVGILAFSLAACSKSEAPTPKISERTEPSKPQNSAQPQQPTLPPLDQEAVALAEKAFSETWTHVGDSWLTYQRHNRSNLGENYSFKYIQIRGVTFRVGSAALSEADTLNGFQWKGWVVVFFRLRRDYSLDESPTRQWSSWEDAPSDGELWIADRQRSYNIVKKNGQWEITPNRIGDGYMLTKPSEEQIKGILTQ
jgi:hypothetical protein